MSHFITRATIGLLAFCVVAEISREQLLQSRRVPGMVTRVAIDNGFWHMGRFAVAYRALFGERPTDTLHRSGAA